MGPVSRSEERLKKKKQGSVPFGFGGRQDKEEGGSKTKELAGKVHLEARGGMGGGENVFSFAKRGYLKGGGCGGRETLGKSRRGQEKARNLSQAEKEPREGINACLRAKKVDRTKDSFLTGKFLNI